MNEATGTLFRDVIFGVLFAFVALVVFFLPHLHPPTEGEDTAKPPGNLIVEARWPDDLDVDVDLWVKAPNDRPVGFSNSHGAVFDLLRDDVGSERDATGLNYEFAFCRGTPAGDYVVNIHLYSNRVGAPVVTVHVVVTLEVDGIPTPVSDERVALRGVGRELTVVRFTLDADGRVVPGSVHDTPIALRGR